MVGVIIRKVKFVWGIIRNDLKPVKVYEPKPIPNPYKEIEHKPIGKLPEKKHKSEYVWDQAKNLQPIAFDPVKKNDQAYRKLWLDQDDKLRKKLLGYELDRMIEAARQANPEEYERLTQMKAAEVVEKRDDTNWFTFNERIGPVLGFIEYKNEGTKPLQKYTNGVMRAAEKKGFKAELVNHREKGLSILKGKKAHKVCVTYFENGPFQKEFYIFLGELWNYGFQIGLYSDQPMSGIMNPVRVRHQPGSKNHGKLNPLSGVWKKLDKEGKAWGWHERQWSEEELEQVEVKFGSCKMYSRRSYNDMFRVSTPEERQAQKARTGTCDLHKPIDAPQDAEYEEGPEELELAGFKLGEIPLSTLDYWLGQDWLFGEFAQQVRQLATFRENELQAKYPVKAELIATEITRSTEEEPTVPTTTLYPAQLLNPIDQWGNPRLKGKSQVRNVTRAQAEGDHDPRPTYCETMDHFAAERYQGHEEDREDEMGADAQTYLSEDDLHYIQEVKKESRPYKWGDVVKQEIDQVTKKGAELNSEINSLNQKLSFLKAEYLSYREQWVGATEISQKEEIKKEGLKIKFMMEDIETIIESKTKRKVRLGAQYLNLKKGTLPDYKVEQLQRKARMNAWREALDLIQRFEELGDSIEHAMLPLSTPEANWSLEDAKNLFRLEQEFNKTCERLTPELKGYIDQEREENADPQDIPQNEYWKNRRLVKGKKIRRIQIIENHIVTMIRPKANKSLWAVLEEAQQAVHNEITMKVKHESRVELLASALREVPELVFDALIHQPQLTLLARKWFPDDVKITKGVVKEAAQFCLDNNMDFPFTVSGKAKKVRKAKVKPQYV